MGHKKTPNLSIMDNEGELHVTITANIFNNISIEKFPSLGKEVPGQEEETLTTLN